MLRMGKSTELITAARLLKSGNREELFVDKGSHSGSMGLLWSWKVLVAAHSRALKTLKQAL